MKKSLILICLTLLFGSAVQADTVGFVNLAKVFENTPDSVEFREKFERKQKELQELFEKKTKKIDDAYKKGTSEDDIKGMLEKRDEELEPKKQELMQMEFEFKQGFEQSVKANLKSISSEYEIDVVIDQQFVYFGGFDLTDLLIERLKDQSK